VTKALLARLEESTVDIKRFREQQRFIVGVLKSDAYFQHIGGAR